MGVAGAPRHFVCLVCLLVVAVVCFIFVILSAYFGCSVVEDLRFASYYGDHMVLQKAPQRASLWGFGPEGSQVTIHLSGPSTQNITSAPVTEGIWLVSLDPVDAGGPYNVTAVCRGSSRTLTDVLFGDVWLCGGQSNMYFQTSQIFNASEELALSSKYPHVRTFMAALDTSDTELTDLIGVELPWSVPSANVVSQFSAVCWLFGRYMYDRLKYPVGLVESCWGGTPVEAWSSGRALKLCGLDDPEDSPQTQNSALWNAMIHPLLNMTIYGAIWYQGEANANYHKDKYNCSFPAMIDDWRMAFHQGSGWQTAPDFPFGFVQLATYKENTTDDGFPDIRWHQTADVGFVSNLRMKKTFMAVAFDLPDKTSPYGTIHPRDKQDVAHRLTLGARAVAYGEKGVAFAGPFPYRIVSTDESVNITYDQPVSVAPSKNIFEICCSERKAPCGPGSSWVPAAILSWNQTSVQLSASSCPRPSEATAVRYAWSDWPCGFKACPVYSAARILPAPPFLIHKYSGPLKRPGTPPEQDPRGE
ncbi:sialate O-acetylesterase isoform X3 [Kryptolebias marmoratus]|uniref:Sialic acid acetylesterase n=1 Tax=Kryptolebias marmoratus TaxID=37003 RepID=A0A3Q2ZIH6_KRYMA|nr:sialate O-acetylesterase isoform X3 [Kryptolebias marmoratus]